ncbi:MAG: hypothetical protein IPH13_21505 [Planctomycetes bacterium]|nr:hypothetical protein [Planctomycetota bacterium]MCC7169430.1 hypothetical protein [Planctomycetota bacterium]
MIRAATLALVCGLLTAGCDGSRSEDAPNASSVVSSRLESTAPILVGQQAGLAVVVSAAASAPPAGAFGAAVGIDGTLRWVHVAIYQLDAGESFAFAEERPRLTLSLADGPIDDLTFGAALGLAAAQRTTVPALALETFSGTRLPRGGVVRALAAFDVAVDLGTVSAGELRIGTTSVPLRPARLDVDGLEDLWEASSRELVVARLAAATATEPQTK